MKHAISITVVVLAGSVGGVLGAEAVDSVLNRFEKQIDRARQTYNRAAQTASASAVRQLATIGKRAADAGNDEDAAEAYKEILRLNRNHGQARAYFAERGTLEQTLTQLTKEWTPAILPGAPKWEEQVFYETMLGAYNDGSTPFVSLAVPNGRNVRTAHILKIVTTAAPEGVDPSLKSYSGSGQFVAKKEGEYTIRYWGALRIDDQTYGDKHSPNPLTVRLTPGLHTLHTGSTYEFRQIQIEIVSRKTGKRVPVFNSLAQIKAFLSTRLSGHLPIEVSGWDPDKARPLRIELPDR